MSVILLALGAGGLLTGGVVYTKLQAPGYNFVKSMRATPAYITEAVEETLSKATQGSFDDLQFLVPKDDATVAHHDYRFWSLLESKTGKDFNRDTFVKAVADKEPPVSRRAVMDAVFEAELSTYGLELTPEACVGKNKSTYWHRVREDKTSHFSRKMMKSFWNAELGLGGTPEQTLSNINRELQAFAADDVAKHAAFSRYDPTKPYTIPAPEEEAPVSNCWCSFNTSTPVPEQKLQPAEIVSKFTHWAGRFVGALEDDSQVQLLVDVSRLLEGKLETYGSLTNKLKLAFIDSFTTMLCLNGSMMDMVSEVTKSPKVNRGQVTFVPAAIKRMFNNGDLDKVQECGKQFPMTSEVWAANHRRLKRIVFKLLTNGKEESERTPFQKWLDTQTTAENQTPK